ncbi:bifunctional diguanylate cyclase/phosphodiesterase [Actinoplanes sp. TFC3]|uniref:putative bifunctional diguanylate cyclase/phosphodiesterase n=1 Tax=Actinoplanes sp. TFC3 TaxID=1710355 RepID=UPI0008357A28|nr:bifunctional diguanylate cyclase/phosphodiesterase [Actinoplanes sp. TFC3]
MWRHGASQQAARSGSRLFVTYAVVSLLPLGALGALLLHGAGEDAAHEGQDQGKAQAAVIAEMAVAPALDGADLTRGLTAGQRESLAKVTDLAVYHGSVLRMRLRAFSGQVVARLGGDEFAVILPATGVDDVRALLERVRADLTRDVVLDGVPLTIEASFGVALYPRHGDDVETLLKRADAAMYQGKRGTADIVVYAGEKMAHPTQWLVVQAELRRALQRDELQLHYQPKMRLADGQISGVEALVRWQHPERGLLFPAEFLPAAELSGLIEPLTAWVLWRALADQTTWLTTGRDWPVAVNVSARNLEAPGFAALVTRLLAEFGTAPGRLIIEITETAMADDLETARATLYALRAAGVGVSIDDFGTGCTNLARLRGVPITEVKIDRIFVGDVQHDPESQAIIRGVVALAHGLGARVTAEGVETTETAGWIADAGCDEAQGYLYSRPVPWTHLSVPDISRPVGRAQ